MLGSAASRRAADRGMAELFFNRDATRLMNDDHGVGYPVAVFLRVGREASGKHIGSIYGLAARHDLSRGEKNERGQEYIVQLHPCIKLVCCILWTGISWPDVCLFFFFYLFVMF